MLMYDDSSLQLLEYHRSMLEDGQRTGSFLMALLNIVKFASSDSGEQVSASVHG